MSQLSGFLEAHPGWEPIESESEDDDEDDEDESEDKSDSKLSFLKTLARSSTDFIFTNLTYEI